MSLLAMALGVLGLAWYLSQPVWSSAYALRSKNLDAYSDLERGRLFPPGQCLEAWECNNVGRHPDLALLACLAACGGAVALGHAWAALFLLAPLPTVLAFATLHREQTAWAYLRRTPRYPVSWRRAT